MALSSLKIRRALTLSADCFRFYSQIGENARTRVVFLHFGQPKSEFYARQFLADEASLFYNVPEKLKSLVSTPFLVGNRVKRCIEDYGKREALEITLDAFAKRVQSAVTEVVPEFGPVECSTAFLFEGDSFQKTMQELTSRAHEHVIFVPLQPHFHCPTSGHLLSSVAHALMKSSVSAVEDGRHVEGTRIVPGSSISFNVSAIHCWGDHPVLSNLWWEKLRKVEGKYDSILFAAPYLRGPSSLAYRNAVWASAERVMAELDFHVPFDVGYFNGWDQWRFPFTQCMRLKGRRLAGSVENPRRVAVVPITSVFPSFDTFSVLPQLLAKMPRCFLVPPPEPASSSVLVQGVAELVKNHLLGRRNAQLQLYCNGCTKKSCQCSRLLFA